MTDIISNSTVMRTSLFSIVMASFCSLQAGAQSATSDIHAENCLVQYINKVNVAAKADGTLMKLMFEEGATVTKGDVLAVIDDTAAGLALELKKAEEKEAILNADNEVNLKDAVNSEKLAAAEAEAYKELRREGAIPYWDMEKKILEAERAMLRIDLAVMNKKIADAQKDAKSNEVKIAEFELTRRMVTAPSTGFIESRIAQLGEWVQPGSPLFTVIQMDKLRVEGDIDALRYPGRIKQGMKVDVLVYRYSQSSDEEAVAFTGKLGFVSMEIDLNNHYRVWVELENEKKDGDWWIKPGMKAEIIIRSTDN